MNEMSEELRTAVAFALETGDWTEANKVALEELDSPVKGTVLVILEKP